MQDVYTRSIGKHAASALDYPGMDIDTPDMGVAKVVMPDLQRLSQCNSHLSNVRYMIAYRIKQSSVEIRVLVVVVAFVCAVVEGKILERRPNSSGGH